MSPAEHEDQAAANHMAWLRKRDAEDLWGMALVAAASFGAVAYAFYVVLS